MDFSISQANPLENPIFPANTSLDSQGVGGLPPMPVLTELDLPQLELLRPAVSLSLPEGLDPLTGIAQNQGLTQPLVGGTIPEVPTELLKGDANHDCGLDQTDVNLILQDRGKPISGIDDPRDVDGDGKITIRDSALLGRQVQANTDKTGPAIAADLLNDSNGVTNNPLIAGTLTDGSKVTKFLAGFDSTPELDYLELRGTLDGEGNFSLNAQRLQEINDNNPLLDGQHTLHFLAKDKWNNVSRFSLIFTLDTTVPTQPGFALAPAFDSAPLGDSRTTFEAVGLYGQTEGNVKVTLVGTGKEAISSATGQFSFTDVTLALGDNPFTVQVMDLAGNVSQFTNTIKRVAEDNSDVIIDWNATLLKAIQTDKTPPPLASRNMAMVHAAIYDAVNGISQTYESYYVTQTAPLGASPEAAAAAAAHRVLVTLYPNQTAAFEGALAASLAKIAEGTAKTDGLAYGQQVADEILAWRSNDGSNQVVNYTPGTAPGVWQPTPPNFAPALYPHWGSVTPFAMVNGSQFRPSGPPALDSAEYAAEYNQVKELGKLDSSTRTAEQTEIAKFWADGSGTFTPPGHWNQIAEQLTAESRNSLVENARLFALLNIGLADAGIACWESKYTYNFWRPVTAIQQGDKDGNSLTVGDANWMPLLVTPNFPEYVSGHSTFSGAGSTILGGLLGNNVSFSTNSLGLPGISRQFDSFVDAADEAGISRIYGGIHFFSANEDGLAEGRALGNYILANFLAAKPGDTVAPNTARISLKS